jgi:hypothetical protein
VLRAHGLEGVSRLATTGADLADLRDALGVRELAALDEARDSLLPCRTRLGREATSPSPL